MLVCGSKFQSARFFVPTAIARLQLKKGDGSEERSKDVPKGITFHSWGGEVTFPSLAGHVTSSINIEEGSPNMAKCPYCDGNIHDDAFVCSYCGRDLNKTYPLPREFQFTLERNKRKKVLSRFVITVSVLFALGLVFILLVWNSY